MCKKNYKPNILNVFITYKHDTGAVYLDKLKQLLNVCIEKLGMFDGYDLIYDRNCGYDYTYIGELYNITDLDIFLISKKVDTSEWVMGEIQEMNKRKIPIIPIRYEGYEDNIGQVINPNTVDALPVDLLHGKEPDEEIIEFLVSRMRQSLEHFDRRKRDKAVKEIMKQAKKEEGGFRVFGWLIETVEFVKKEAKEGVKKGATKFIQKLVSWVVYILLVALALFLLGQWTGWDDMLKNIPFPW